MTTTKEALARLAASLRESAAAVDDLAKALGHEPPPMQPVMPATPAGGNSGVRFTMKDADARAVYGERAPFWSELAGMPGAEGRYFVDRGTALRACRRWDPSLLEAFYVEACAWRREQSAEKQAAAQEKRRVTRRRGRPAPEPAEERHGSPEERLKARFRQQRDSASAQPEGPGGGLGDRLRATWAAEKKKGPKK